MDKNFIAKDVFEYSYFGWSMSQSSFDDGMDDYGERVYIYESMAFEVIDGAEFYIEADGTRRIENFAIEPISEPANPENFDFDGGFLSNLGNVTLEDVAGSALYFLGDHSRGVSGEVSFVDCGYNIMGI